MNVLDRIKSGETDLFIGKLIPVTAPVAEHEAAYKQDRLDRAELLALARRGARYRWVFLKDDKPPETQAVLVHYKAIGYDMVRIASLINGKWHVEGGNVVIDFDRVVKWMMLPESEEEG